MTIRSSSERGLAGCHLRHWRARLRLLQRKRDLLVCVTRLLHAQLLARRLHEAGKLSLKTEEKIEGTSNTVTTYIFTPDCPYLAEDAVFGVKHSMTAGYRQIDDVDKAKNLDVSAPYWEVEWDSVLARSEDVKRPGFSGGSYL